MIDLNKKFCGRPWEFLEIHDDGGLKVYNCCPNWVNHNDLGKMNYDTNFENIWNGEKSKEFRKSILDGSFKYCNRTECPMIQNGSLPDKNDIRDGKHGEYYKKIIEDNVLISENADFINLCYDVSCNLKCPSCRPTFWFLNEKINPIDFNLKRLFQIKFKKSMLINLDKPELIITVGDPAKTPAANGGRKTSLKRFSGMYAGVLSRPLIGKLYPM